MNGLRLNMPVFIILLVMSIFISWIGYSCTDTENFKIPVCCALAVSSIFMSLGMSVKFDQPSRAITNVRVVTMLYYIVAIIMYIIYAFTTSNDVNYAVFFGLSVFLLLGAMLAVVKLLQVRNEIE